MEVNRESWHWRLLKKFSYTSAWKMESFPDEYSHLCFYSKALLVIFFMLLLAVATVILLAFPVIFVTFSALAWVAESIWYMQLMEVTDTARAGIILLCTLSTGAILTYLFLWYLRTGFNLKWIRCSRAGEVLGDFWASIRGKYCVKITLK